MRTHPFIEGVQAIETAPRQKRVLAVLWGEHDRLTCDGQDLSIDTTGFLRCPVSRCRWSFDPEFLCPEHREGVA